MKICASKLVCHPRLLRQVADGLHELQVHVLLPHLERRHQEVVDARDGGGLEQELRLRAALLAGDEHLGDRRRLGVGQLAVHLAYEVAAQRDEEEDAEAAARQADEDRLHRVRIELEDVERRQREHRAGDHGARGAADAREDDVLEQRRAAPVDARQADREDRDRDRRLHHLADLQPRVGRREREDDAEEQAPEDRARRSLGQGRAGRHDGRVVFACRQRLVGVVWQPGGVEGGRHGLSRCHSGGFYLG